MGIAMSGRSIIIGFLLTFKISLLNNNKQQADDDKNAKIQNNLKIKIYTSYCLYF